MLKKFDFCINIWLVFKNKCKLNKSLDTKDELNQSSVELNIS